MTILGRGMEWLSFFLGYIAGLVEGTSSYLTGNISQGYLQGVRQAHKSWVPGDFPVD